MRFLFGDCILDPTRRELLRGGEAIHVEPQVLDLLLHLVRNREQVVSKDDLLAAVAALVVVLEPIPLHGDFKLDAFEQRERVHVAQHFADDGNAVGQARDGPPTQTLNDIRTHDIVEIAFEGAVPIDHHTEMGRADREVRFQVYLTRTHLDRTLERAEALAASHAYEEALEAYRAAAPGVEASGSASLQVRALAGEAWALQDPGHVREAIELLQRARELVEQPEFSDVDRADVLFRLAVCRYKLSSISTATSLLG